MYLPATLTAAATTATAGLVLRFVDLERTPAHVLAIEVLNRSRRIGTRHFHEAEAARSPGFAIHDQCNRIDRAVLAKTVSRTAFSSAEKGKLPT